MRVVIFSGTTEGRALSHALAQRGAEVSVCVATEYGREEQGTAPGVQVHTGRMEEADMAKLLLGAALCVDATHPYAVQATANVRRAARAVGTQYVRLLRPKSALPAGGVLLPGTKEAAAWLAVRKGNVLLATGAKELGAFAALKPNRLYPRVLPVAQSLAVCEAAGIPRRNIIAMQGPFSREMNEAMLRQFDIRYLVTKDGGAAGGFAEKAAAAQATGTTLVVLDRPPETGEDYNAVLRRCEERLQCR